jgi:hypothetical protein
LNKDRKRLVQETVKSIITRLACVKGQHMAQDILIKQSDIRTNGNALQIKRLKDQAQMLAEGGEWVETPLGDIIEPASTPIELPDDKHTDNVTTTSLHELLENSNTVGGTLELSPFRLKCSR